MKRTVFALGLTALSLLACGGEHDAEHDADRVDVRRQLFATPYGVTEIEYRVVDGVGLFQWDIEVPVEGDVSPATTAQTYTVGPRSFVGPNLWVWPQRVIPYRLDGSLSPTLRSTVLSAIADYAARTPLRWVEDVNASAVDYVSFQSTIGRCWSWVGRKSGRQTIELAETCGSNLFDTVEHEMGHAIGLFHEHARPDAADYIQVDFSNLPFGAIPGDFQPLVSPWLDHANAIGAFDFNSIMLYPATWTSVPKPGQPTMVQRWNGQPYPNPHQGHGLAPGDIDAIYDLYVDLGPNRIGDPGFEGQTTSQPLGGPWFGSNGPHVWAGTDRGLGKAHGSANNGFVFADGEDATWAALNQWVNVQPNKTYVVRGWVRTSPGLETAQLQVRAEGGDLPVLGSVQVPSDPAGQGYRRVTFAFKSQAATRVLFVGGFWPTPPTPVCSPVTHHCLPPIALKQWLQLDDVELAELD